MKEGGAHFVGFRRLRAQHRDILLLELLQRRHERHISIDGCAIMHRCPTRQGGASLQTESLKLRRSLHMMLGITQAAFIAAAAAAVQACSDSWRAGGCAGSRGAAARDDMGPSLIEL